MDAKSESQRENPTPDTPNGGRPWIGIFVNEDGSIKVNGNMSDKVIAYGLLEVARDLIGKHLDMNHKVEDTKGHILSFLRNGKRII